MSDWIRTFPVKQARQWLLANDRFGSTEAYRKRLNFAGQQHAKLGRPAEYGQMQPFTSLRTLIESLQQPSYASKKMEQTQLECALEKLRELRKADRGQDLSTWIADQIDETTNDRDAAVLRDELVHEHRRHQRYSAAQAILEASMEREPNEPFYSLSLAEHFHYYDVNLERSLGHVADAIVKARADGKFLYQALGVQARLCVETENWRLLESTLIDLTLYEHTPGNADVFPETDFIARIPAEAVPADVVTRYKDRVGYLRSIGYSTMSGPCAT